MSELIAAIAIVVTWLLLSLLFIVFWHHLKKGHHASPTDYPRTPSNPEKPDTHSNREQWPPLR